MTKLDIWSTKDKAEKELNKRLSFSKEQKSRLTFRWKENERLVFNTKGGNLSENADINIPVEFAQLDGAGVDQGSGTSGTNFLFKNLRFIHAQMSANPPSVLPRPTSSDAEDRRAADAANKVVQHAMRQYNLQEKTDSANLNCLLYGTGFLKIMWDTEKGDILDIDEETGKLLFEGDISVSVPNPWDIFIDPEATSWEDVRYVFERVFVPYEEAVFNWPESKDLFDGIREQQSSYPTGIDSQAQRTESMLKHKYYDSLELYQYWEKGLPTNGYQGRFCICTKGGQLVGAIQENPERYRQPAVKGKKSFAKAHLPFVCLTDIDVPNSFWGKSFVEFGTNLQDNLNRLDTVLLENIQAHGVARLLLPEGTEVADGTFTNSPLDIIKFSGNQMPQYMAPMALPQGMSELREKQKLGIDDMSGVNESMFGQQSRETSGFSMQYATNQGNLIRRRLFNKYTIMVEQLYKRILQITQNKWTTPRTIQVLGTEKAFEATDIKGADLESGYSFVSEYGTSFSLDPTTRREEILTLMPLFEKAGMKPREILNKLKLSDISSLYDAMELAGTRQKEVFEEMLSSGLYIAPEELQDHRNMLDYSYNFVMTAEFKYLTSEQKALIKEHIKAREQLAASEQAQLAGGGVPGPDAQGLAGAPPALPGSAGPMDVTQLPPLGE